MLNKKLHYLQIALNSTLGEAEEIIGQLPVDERILIEAGTPLLKTYGEEGIRMIENWWQQRIYQERGDKAFPGYVIADYKAMDRGTTEVGIAHRAGASAITVLGSAPAETIDVLVDNCQKQGLDSIIDMMNVDQPFKVLRKLKRLPAVVMLHRGVDETEMGEKPLPIHQINKIKGSYDVMVAIGGGDTIREVQRAIFNNADIVMVWKEFYCLSSGTGKLAEEFLKEIK
ncbi:MAG: hypothetical protein COU82_02165 [Candidatus Portnoybacteria bacterium CG10_big_fil_rev_8_21_14_0_10_38_18]|uniref:Orotidine 5'-phosphate decarboxylase domain-containing protein n=1 Tax=Candidatus Portnoybacteria bacterium CG10_big_fil_rev_8_21_14_0_10_38_18 TaxID=1974813 RepID=A0A2M8KBW7_9BACT|nr:MAG: hypothetical protein COU82_02165 [Candidatus Portnoybacteria bacterium CG10_big_fil_rev_8_21_14_0_10_38_18]